ncbi:hypothetical protein PG993_015126 [Apiospora rasikravindrae]|uniref:Uncharacterized protein n=1 Tax=Apiospora rasikravindrae TaxID=990691 RepID=A0ABR1RPX0_9PEZI
MAFPRFEGLWSKWLLLPCWIIQMGGSIVFGISGALLLIAATYSEQVGTYTVYGYDMQDIIDLVRATGAVVLAFAVMTFLFCLVEIALYATRVLNPAVVLAFACFKALGWAAMIALDIFAAVRGSGFSWPNFILSFALLTTALVQLFVSAKYVHHQRLAARDRGQYEKAGAVEAGSYHPSGNYTQVSTPKQQQQQQFQQQDTEYRSPSPEDLAGGRRDDMSASPLFSDRDHDSVVVGARRAPGASFIG